MKYEYDVVSLGCASLDVIFVGMDQWAEPGKERVSRDFALKPGSGAVNVSAALARLGLRSALVSTIGQDEPGSLLWDMIARTGADMSLVTRSPGYRTTVSAALGYQGDRGFVTYFASQDTRGELARFENALPKARLAHLSLSDCLRLPYAALAKQSGATVTIDSGWDESACIDNVAPILQSCDVFFTNSIEAEHIFGGDSPEASAERMAHYIDTFVIKLGCEGSFLYDRGRVTLIPPLDAGPAVEMTGAGDLYCAGFIYGLLHGWPMERCARFGSASGGVAVTFYGGVDDAYTLSRVNQVYEQITS